MPTGQQKRAARSRYKAKFKARMRALSPSEMSKAAKRSNAAKKGAATRKAKALAAEEE